MERTAGTLRHHHIRRPSDGREDGSAHLLRASKVSRSSNDQNHWYEQHDQPARNDYLPEETQETQHENRYTVALRSDFAVPPVSGHLMPLNTVLTCLLAAGVQGRCAARASSLHWYATLPPHAEGKPDRRPAPPEPEPEPQLKPWPRP